MGIFLFNVKQRLTIGHHILKVIIYVVMDLTVTFKERVVWIRSVVKHANCTLLFI